MAGLDWMDGWMDEKVGVQWTIRLVFKYRLTRTESAVVLAVHCIVPIYHARIEEEIRIGKVSSTFN